MRFVSIGALATAIAIGAIVVGGGGPTTAHVFVATTGSDSCTRNAALVTYSAAVTAGNVCLTWNKAYTVANQPDNVLVETGKYGLQATSADASKTSANGNCNVGIYSNGDFPSPSTAGCVTFLPDAGATVQLGAHTTTTSAVDVSPGNGGSPTTTIPVVSTADFFLNWSSNTQYRISTGNPGVTSSFICTGKTSNSFTGCSSYYGSCTTSGGELCGWHTGTDIIEGGFEAVGSYARFQNMSMVGGFDTYGSTNVIFDNITAPFFSLCSSYGDVINSTIGNNNGSGPSYVSYCSHDNVIYKTTIANATIDGCDSAFGGNVAYFCHGDGIYIQDIENLYLVRDKFYNNAIQQIIDDGDAGLYNGLWIVNSMFGDLATTGDFTGSYNAQIYINADGGSPAGTFSNVTIEGNSNSGNPWLVRCVSCGGGTTFSNWTVTGNIGIDINCSTPTGVTTWGVTDTYNLVSGTACSSGSSPVANNNTGSVNMGILWVNTALGNLQLVSGATAAESTWTGCGAILSVDYSGTARPSTCNAGADQR